MTVAHRPALPIPQLVRDALAAQPTIDLHTHLYGPAFGAPVPNGYTDVDPAGLMLWGIDELLTYHYLIAEVFRVVRPADLTPRQFFAMPKPRQAELIWRKLFLDRSPVSEACRGVLTTLQKLGLDTADRNLDGIRTYFNQLDPDRHLDHVMELARIESITMTNNVFDDNERARWLTDAASLRADGRFKAVLRFDPLLCDWPAAAKKLSEWGYPVSETTDDVTVEQVKKFLRDWLGRTQSVYAAVSLPPSFRYPATGHCAKEWQAGGTILSRAVLPVCAERGIPFAMMIGSQRAVNPALRDAGDMGFAADVRSVANLCAEHPQNRFLVTMLSDQNQHELAVAARKFENLMIFGCWWFLNIPHEIDRITRVRMELLGTSFVPQHSDARVLEQLLYKWEHSRRIIGDVLTAKYEDLAATGWIVSESDVKRDVALLLRENFRNFLAG